FGVGKTSLIRRFVHQKFSDQYLTTIGVKVDRKEVEVEGQALTLMIWDIAGEANLSKVSQQYLLGAHGLIYCLDLSRRETFENLQEDLFELTKNLGDVPILILGNKADLLTQEEQLAITKEITLSVTLTSAKTGDNVDATFDEMARLLL
ncbi:MAG: Rab family GTPase, partial [Bacteroidota bacterium]